MSFSDEKVSILDNDLDQNKLDLAISKNPNLKFLKHFGEIHAYADGDFGREDNRFTAPYQEGNVVGGGIDKTIKKINIVWSPDEKDVEYLEEQVKFNEVTKEEFDLFKKTVLAEPRKALNIDVTEVLTDKALEKIENDILERHQD